MSIGIGMSISFVKRAFQLSEASLPLALLEHDQDPVEPFTPRRNTHMLGKPPGIGRAQGRVGDQAGRQRADFWIIDPDHEILVARSLALVLKVVAHLKDFS